MELGKGQYTKSLSNRAETKKYEYGCANDRSNNNHGDIARVAFEDCVCRFNPQKSDGESDPVILHKSRTLDWLIKPPAGKYTIPGTSRQARLSDARFAVYCAQSAE